MVSRGIFSSQSFEYLIVKPPVVATGAGIIEGKKLLIAASVIGVLAIAIITAWTRHKGNQATNLNQ